MIALGVAITDEIYQSFIPGRDASVTDVLLDVVGIAAAMLLSIQFYKKHNLKIHYQKVRFKRGVDKILRLSNHTFPISDKVIETIRARMGKDKLLKLKGKWKEEDATGTDSSPFENLREIFVEEMYKRNAL